MRLASTHALVITVVAAACGSDGDASVAGSGGGGSGGGQGGSGASGGCIAPAGTGVTDAVCDDLPTAGFNCNPDAIPFQDSFPLVACRDGFVDYEPGAAESFAICLAQIETGMACLDDPVDACRTELVAASCPETMMRGVEACEAFAASCTGVPEDPQDCLDQVGPLNEAGLASWSLCLQNNMAQACYFTLDVCTGSLHD